MTTDKEPTNIIAAINRIYAEIGYVQKEGSVNFGNTKYKYAGEAAFIAALRPVMVKYGVTVRVTATKLVYQAPGHVIIQCKYAFEHISGTVVYASAMGEGKDSGDKAIPKALTGAYKYALRQTFMLETGDDPDKVSSEELIAIEEKQKEASAKKRGQAILAEMANLKDTDDLDNFTVAYKTDINAFRYGSKTDKEFYEQIAAEGKRLREEFKNMESKPTLDAFNSFTNDRIKGLKQNYGDE